SNRRIDDIRDLREKVHIAPTSADYKVYIIDEVHMLTGESFNALLKTLEEPPAHVVFILATTEVHKLPATIVSRTQRYHFRPVAKQKVVAHLKELADKEHITIEPAALELIADYGEGSFRDSISLLDQLATMSGKHVTAAFVQEGLGLASSEDIAVITSLILKGQGEQLHKKLVSLEEQGVSAPILSQQLIRALKDEAPKRPDLYALINDLLEIIKSSQPELKLLVSLLLFVQQGGVPEKPKQQSAPTLVAAAPVVSAPAVKQPIPAPSSHSRRTKQVAPAPKQRAGEESALQKIAGAKQLTATEWMSVLAELKRSNPPLFSVLKKAAADFNGETLTLTFSFKLHQTKLDDGRYRNKLIQCVQELGFNCPMIVTAFDKTITVTEITLPEAESTPVDETTSSVLAMMGGGEVVNGS
ncbi:hypothetical protein CYG49_02675, partial [Candidatus Saccharibacteria bacterium]